MNEHPQHISDKPSHPVRRIGVYFAVLVIVFLVGFIPMWQKAIKSDANLSTTQRELRLSRMQNTLASAVIDANRGDYEPARQAASSFFTTLGVEVEKEDDSAFSQQQREGMNALFNERDELITLLARNDPASAARLSDLYVLFRKIMNG